MRDLEKISHRISRFSSRDCQSRDAKFSDLSIRDFEISRIFFSSIHSNLEIYDSRSLKSRGMKISRFFFPRDLSRDSSRLFYASRYSSRFFFISRFLEIIFLSRDSYRISLTIGYVLKINKNSCCKLLYFTKI